MWASSLLCEFGTHSDGARKREVNLVLFIRYPIEGRFTWHGVKVMEDRANTCNILISFLPLISRSSVRP